MNISEFSIQLRALANDYSSHRIEFSDYRAKRKAILDNIDIEINRLDLITVSETDVNVRE